MKFRLCNTTILKRRSDMHDDAFVDATMVAVYQISRAIYATTSSHPLLADDLVAAVVTGSGIVARVIN